MISTFKDITLTTVAAVCLLLLAPAAIVAELIDISSQLELFVNDELIDRMQGVRLELQKPVPAGKVMDFDQPWEGVFTTYPHIFRDGDKWRMYYRGARPEFEGATPEIVARGSNICYAESKDGIHWTKPNLRLYEFAGTWDNNITYFGTGSNKWYCFKDENPGEPPERRYKAFCGTTYSHGAPLTFLISPDGLRWTPWQTPPGIQGGPLDTLNVVRWDPRQQRYLAYVRNWVTQSGGFDVPPNVDASPSEYNTWWGRRGFFRAIAVSSSPDCVNWSRQQWLKYSDPTVIEHLYTNAVTPYFRAPHLYVSFPKRYVPDRQIVVGWQSPIGGHGCSDAVFMSSRDGLHWDRRFLEAFLRPGLDVENWTDRNMMISPGVIQTGPGEMSLYYVAHYGHKTCHLRRVVLRLDGFVAVHADYRGGELVTKPLVFDGSRLVINFSTSAVGDVRVEVQDADGTPIDGYALADAREIVGDHIAKVVEWKGGSDVSSLAGRPVRLRFLMSDADVYSFRFSTP